jgi:hypothetical protein
MSQVSYIRAAGDPDYNFAYSDFTVEFFVEAPDTSGCQTLFEISNNESAAANLYAQTRFFTVIENGNLNAYAIQTMSAFYVGAGVTTFTSPVPITANDRIFYDGQFLISGDYTVSGTTINLLILPNTMSTVLVEIGQVLFQIQGQSFSENAVHFVSAERFQNEFYLFLDGQSQSAPVPAFNAIPTQVIANTAGTGNLQRFNGPALLTIGANKNGKDALFGKFGDFKITNGVSRHVQQSQIQEVISSSFTTANLGTQASAINIDGGNFVDSVSSYTPEELVPGQIFDTLYLQVYQTTNISNSTIPTPPPPFPVPPGQNVIWAFPETATVYTISPGGSGNASAAAAPLPATGNIAKDASGPIGNNSVAMLFTNFQVGGTLSNSAVIFDIYPVMVASYNRNQCFASFSYGQSIFYESTGGFGNSGTLFGLSYPLSASFPSQELTGSSLGTDLSLLNTAGIGGSVSQSLSIGGFSPADTINATFIGFAIYYSGNIANTGDLLSFSLFKPTIMSGPTGSYSFQMPANGNVYVPWSELDAAAASVLVNGNAILSNAWTVQDSIFNTNAAIGANIEIISTGPTTYFDVSENSVATLMSNLYANSTTINVSNVAPFITPIVGDTSNVPNVSLLNVRGQVFINQECITYLYIDRIANTLSGLLRGTSGTGVPNIHLAGSRIVNGSYNVDLENLAMTDPRTKIWYTVPLNGTGLQNTNTEISSVLVNNGGLPTLTPF